MKIVRSELMFESRCQCKKAIVHYGECSVTNEYRETRREVFGSSLLVGQSNSKLEGTSARKTLSETDETKATAPATFEASSGSSFLCVVRVVSSFFMVTGRNCGVLFFRVEDATWKKTSWC